MWAPPNVSLPRVIITESSVRAYVPKRFQAPGDSAAREVLAATDFAPLLPVQQGAVQVIHLPVLYHNQGGEYDVFRAHFTRANPRRQHLEDGETLVICRASHVYISPPGTATGKCRKNNTLRSTPGARRGSSPITKKWRR